MIMNNLKNKQKLFTFNLKASFVCVALVLIAGALCAQSTITVLGTSAPTPGASDQYQTNFVATAQSPPPGGGNFNYYVNANPSPGETFTTGNNPNGYVLNSLALYDADNTGGGFGNETFTLGIYSVSGSTATLLTSYTSQSVNLPNFNWFQWSNLDLILQPNTQYAYAMWANGSGWMNLGNNDVSYSGGQVAIVPRGGGTMTFSSSSPWNADFDAGLTPISAPVVYQPTFSPYSITLPGTTITASAAVNGPTPYYFQWQTDGGGGGALTNIPGATSSNLVINTTGFALRDYQYDVVVANNTSSSTSQVAVLTVQEPTGIAGAIAIKFGFTNGYATSDVPYPADNAGVVNVGNWNDLQANIPSGASVAQRVAAMDTTWNINQDTAGNPLSGVTLTANGWDDGWYNGGTECENGRLLYDVWKVNAGAESQSGFGNTYEDSDSHYFATCAINNLPLPVYDVYVYINDNNGNYWGNLEANSQIAVGNNLDTDGFNGADFDPCDASPEFHTASGYDSPVNYIKVPGVTTSGGAITLTVVEQGGEMGVAGIELVPASDITLEQDTQPNYAETVAGDQVVFTAAFSNSPPVNLQWLDVSGGVTNIVNTGMVNVLNNGVMTSTLTLNNVQVASSGSYQLEAINANHSADVAYSDPASLVVFNSPLPTNNIIVDYAGQAGPDGFYPFNWTVNTANDLIYGFPDDSGTGTPGTVDSNAGSGSFAGQSGDNANSDPAILSDGILGDTLGANPTLCACGSAPGGASVTYNLITNSASPYGFDLTNITVYGGWTNPGRNEQDYQVLYSTVEDPTSFVPLALEDYTPGDPEGAPSANRTMLIPATGVLAHNVYAVEINWITLIYPHNGYEGYSEIVIEGPPSSGLASSLVQDINPLTAEDVVGSSLIMTAAFGTNATIQWQQVSGGVTNHINTGVVNVTNNGVAYSTLTLKPLTMSSAGSYSATASNSVAPVTSSSCAVTVEPAPAVVGNLVTAWAYQTSDVFPFTPTWSTNELSSSLIYLQNPPGGGYGSGDFTATFNGDDAGGLPVLSDGNYGSVINTGGNPAFAACGPGAGQYVIYTMPDSGAYGDDITNIQIASGWQNDNRDTQEYTVYYSTVSNPTSFFLLTSVSNSLVANDIPVLRATFTPASGLLAGNVAQIYIDFTTPPGVPYGYSGYSEISVFGKASAALVPPVPPVISQPYYSSGNLIVSGTGGTAHAPYTLLTTTNLLTPVADWTPLNMGSDGNGQTITTGELNGSGAFSNAIPVSATTPASFFMVKMQ